MSFPDRGRGRGKTVYQSDYYPQRYELEKRMYPHIGAHRFLNTGWISAPNFLSQPRTHTQWTTCTAVQGSIGSSRGMKSKDSWEMGRSEDSGVRGLAKQGHSQEGAFPGGWNRDQARKGWELTGTWKELNTEGTEKGRNLCKVFWIIVWWEGTRSCFMLLPTFQKVQAQMEKKKIYNTYET